MNIEQLNQQFGISGQLGFEEGAGGLPLIRIDNDYAQALISLYAGQVLAFRPKTEVEDLLFLSSKAYYQTGKAIKGGVPICWPWFGADPEKLGRPSHGFARTGQWSVSAVEVTPAGETQVTLEFMTTAEMEQLWPSTPSLALVIRVDTALDLELVTRNLGDRTIAITQALHTYFKVGDIGRVRVLGLEDCTYLDKVDGGALKQQNGAVLIDGEVDRVYTGVQDQLVIEDSALARRIRIAPRGSSTAVVWNPWAKIAAEMADLEDDDYLRFICVETANAAEEVIRLQPGAEYRMGVSYSIETGD